MECGHHAQGGSEADRGGRAHDAHDRHRYRQLQLRASSHSEEPKVEQARWRMHGFSQKVEIWHTKGCCEQAPT